VLTSDEVFFQEALKLDDLCVVDLDVKNERPAGDGASGYIQFFGDLAVALALAP
jgi:hypothetical protein